VVGSHGSESDFRSCLLGSTTGELTRIATRPLLVVRKEYNPISHALVGYDASPEATRALDAVVKLAVAGKWRLTIAVVTSHEPAGHTVAAQAERFRGLEHVEHEVIVRRGDAPHTLLELLDDTRAGLVAVGARGQNKLAKFLLGSTSDTLLCQSPVPVMVFR
jgi:nucleotide-binding universal stress UspA family protein